MINIICTILGTGVVIGGAVGAILRGFYKTNKEANIDHGNLKKEILAQFDKEKIELVSHIDKDKEDIHEKINCIEKRLEHELETKNKEIKEDFKQLSDKIDEMKVHFVTNENFKTYADAMSQLLKMSTARMERIEDTLDDIRNDINMIVRTHNNIQNNNN